MRRTCANTMAIIMPDCNMAGYSRGHSWRATDRHVLRAFHVHAERPPGRPDRRRVRARSPRTVPVTQRHAVDRHHSRPTSDSAPLGQVCRRPIGHWSRFLSRQQHPARAGTSSRARQEATSRRALARASTACASNGRWDSPAPRKSIIAADLRSRRPGLPVHRSHSPASHSVGRTARSDGAGRKSPGREPSPDAGAAVHRALRHRCAGLPAQLACDADLRAAGTITALGAHAPRHRRAGPRMRP